MIELTKQLTDRNTCIESSGADILKKTMLFSLSINKSSKRFVKRFWIRNMAFLIDLSVKKETLFDRVHHIIETYGGPNLKSSLPWHVIEFSVKKILRQIMLNRLTKDIQKFKGSIELNADNSTLGEIEHQNLEKLLAFDLIDYDELQDLLNISLPHL